ncbi:hypothetical protein [Novosphingobium gossypii]|uniref:hypothetical protein n=1 Tax=Novosphingobium gossypii TaxID=1604774 RepID=UPI003D1F28E8
MIQSTAPTLTVALPPTPGASAAVALPGDFAALLGSAGAPVSAPGEEGPPAMPSLTATGLTATGLTAAAATPLADAVKGVQSGLEALVKQAGVATSAPRAEPDPDAPIPAFSAPSRIALTVHLAAGSSVAENGAAAPSKAPPATASTEGTPLPAPSALVPAHAQSLPTVAAAPLPDGKNGKSSGKMLPQGTAPEAAVAPTIDAPADSIAAPGAKDAIASTMPLVAAPDMLAPVAPDVQAILTPPVTADRTTRPATLRTPAQPTENQSASPSPIVPEQVRAIRFEPIEIVRIADDRAPPAIDTAKFTAAMTDAAAQPSLRTPVTVAATPGVLPERPVALSIAQAAAGIPGDAPSSATPPPAQAVQSPDSRTMPQQSATAQPAPRMATAPTIEPPPARATVMPDVPPAPETPAIAPEPHRSAPVSIDATAERPSASEPAATRPIPEDPQPPASLLVSPALAAAGSVTPEAAIAGHAPSTVSESPQDFDTLVSRLAEAREAAAPHVVRTAFDHAEFGRVAMQLGQDEGGLSVTLSSRDADFVPAVQAAAVAVASGAAGAGTQDQPRQDNPSSQQQSQSAQAQNAQTQNGQQARADGSASQQQQRREGTNGGAGNNTGQRQQDQQQPGTPARPRDDRRPGGVYA